MGDVLLCTGLCETIASSNNLSRTSRHHVISFGFKFKQHCCSKSKGDQQVLPTQKMRRYLHGTLTCATSLLALVSRLVKAAPTEGIAQTNYSNLDSFNAEVIQFPQQPLSMFLISQACTRMQHTLYTYTLVTFFPTPMQIQQPARTFSRIYSS
jgi:hypothetical protein